MKKREKTNRNLYVGNGGNDVADGLTYATRKRTLAAIEEIAESGDIVYLEPPISKQEIIKPQDRHSSLFQPCHS